VAPTAWEALDSSGGCSQERANEGVNSSEKPETLRLGPC
jgi:hypothetical protein